RGVHARESDQGGSVDPRGRPPERRRRCPLAQPLEQLLAPGDDRRPVRRAEWCAARRPRQDELVERLCDLVPAELEDVLRVLEEAVRRQERAELPYLVPPPREEPVVAEELVLLDVWEDGARQLEQLVGGRARLLVEQRAVLLRAPVALARQPP